jgi:hypothetical protein
MSNTNTNTTNTPTIASAVSTFFQNMGNTNVLNYALYNGVAGIPYATFGLVAAVIGVLVYATVTDEMEEIKEELTQLVPLEQIANVEGETEETIEEDAIAREQRQEAEAAQQEQAELAAQEEQANLDAEKKEEQEEQKRQEEQKEQEQENAQEGEEDEEEPGERYKIGGKSKKSRYHRRRTQKRSRSNRT